MGGISVRDHYRHCNFAFLSVIQVLTKSPFLLGLTIPSSSQYI